MAREQATIKLAIWSDPEFRALSVPAQHLYMVLLTSETLSYCGVADWRPKRIAPLASGWSEQAVQEAGAELARKLFVVIDESTEEVLLRSFVRNDGLMGRTRMATAMAKACRQVVSMTLRGVVVHELKRLREDQPRLGGWDSERAVELLTMPSVDPSTMPLGMPSVMASTMASVEASTMEPVMALTMPLPDSSAMPSTTASAMGSAMGCPTTSYKLQATNYEEEPSSSSPELPLGESEPKRKKPAKPLPDTWKPTAEHREYATKHGLDLEHQVYLFRNHAKSHDRRQVSWNGAFATWLGKATERQPAYANGSLPTHTHRDPKTGRAVER